MTVDGALIADYAYDANSNRIGVAQTGVGMPSSGCAANLANVSASVDAQDRLLSYGSCNYDYTDNGELTRKTDSATAAVTTYQYDSFSNLRQVNLPDGRTIDYLIDGRNRRIGKSIDGVKVHGLVYMNDLEPVAETDGQGNRIATFIYADRANTPSYLLKGGNVYRVIADHLGSVRLVVNVQDGSIAQRLDYDAWGQVIEDTNPGFQPFGFAGGIYDPDTGLVRFGARDYDPETGRWTNKDPIGFGGVDSNLYSYISADPINAVDHNGLIIDTVADVGFFGYDIYRIVTDNIIGDCDNLGTNLLAAGADLLGVFVPFGTGFGAGVRVAKGATRTAARNLAEKLALDEAKAGAGVRIMKGKINDPKFPENVWAKMQHVHDHPDGTQTVIHYWQNVQTGAREGFKFK
ncbi:MAG: RHS repeat-associated core domain-containing protein [Nitrospiraceae bacterium]